MPVFDEHDNLTPQRKRRNKAARKLAAKEGRKEEK